LLHADATSPPSIDYSFDMMLLDRIALITGSCSGIGRSDMFL